MNMKIYFKAAIEENSLKIYVFAKENEGTFPEELMTIKVCEYGISQMIIFTDQVDEILLMQIAKTIKPTAIKFLTQLNYQLKELQKELTKTIEKTSIPTKITEQLKDNDQTQEIPPF